MRFTRRRWDTWCLGSALFFCLGALADSILTGHFAPKGLGLSGLRAVVAPGEVLDPFRWARLSDDPKPSKPTTRLDAVVRGFASRSALHHPLRSGHEEVLAGLGIRFIRTPRCNPVVGASSRPRPQSFKGGWSIISSVIRPRHPARPACRCSPAAGAPAIADRPAARRE